MIQFFQTTDSHIVAVQSKEKFSNEDVKKLVWAFSEAEPLEESELKGIFVGPRREMITPWSTNAVEIIENLGVKNVERIEEFFPVNSKDAEHDKMLQRIFDGLNQDMFTISKTPDPIISIDNIEEYNEKEGLALNPQEIEYLKGVSEKMGRSLTDSEVFGFSQVNSEHCRHKIFGGLYIIDGEEKESSLFQLIKKTSKENPNDLVSAYEDNVAFNEGPVIEQFAPASEDKPDFFQVKPFKSVISLKAETHNFPTTVEPFNGAATGTGGEIRDRLGGGTASVPIAGTAVYMTAYPRNNKDVGARIWEKVMNPRPWLYQTPEEILIKASNGASDFGNKFGQPLICGSLLTFEHEENNESFAYDKVIMLAGGVGYGKKSDALKGHPKVGQKVVLLGGDNYRIGMGGGAVSSVNTGQYSSGIELNAVQRANPEMQKRAANVIRAISEMDENPVISIHDHGAGGHLNCLSELVEESGGKIDMSKLPIGDPTLSAKEIIGNESQERMGLLVEEDAIPLIKRIADRERSPMYVVGETTGDHKFVFEQADGKCPMDWKLEYMIGKPPRTVITDTTIEKHYKDAKYEASKIYEYIENVLQLEAVACKDWLTNKVDRSVTGKVARQQGVGDIQLPLADVGVVALDYRGKAGIATSIGHAPQAALVNPAAGSRLSIAEALTNIVWAPLKKQLESVSLSANWMWPCKNPGEDSRLYSAVQAVSDFAIALGINVPTGKDSLSMTQNYGGKENKKVLAPGTVIISAGAEVYDVKKVLTPQIINDPKYPIYHIDFSFDKFSIGGSAFAQSLNKVGDDVPDVKNPDYFKDAFNAIQELISKDLIIAGHDISAGGMITTLLEMTFSNVDGGLSVNLSDLEEKDLVKILFSENPGVLIQVKDAKKAESLMTKLGVGFAKIAIPAKGRQMKVSKNGAIYTFDIDALRDTWYKSSYMLDRKQSGEECALARFENYKDQPLAFKFGTKFEGSLSAYGLDFERKASTGVKAAIIRAKGVNGDREMAYSMWLAGMDVKDVHMTDLMSGRENLEDVNMIVFVGGFSNSDVLGSAKGWAGGFLFNEKARKALDNFYARKDTLSLGICNGCQCLIELGLINPDHKEKPKMLHNDSHKFESAFVSLQIPDNKSIMFGSLAGDKLGVWVAHGEGKFSLPYAENKYNVIAKYNYDNYPANPNGSDYSVAGLCSNDGRHLAMMPHLERAIFPWQWAKYPNSRKGDVVTPWIEAFVNAAKWIASQK